MTVRPIRRLLIANRGEIACRIIRTARAMGIETVAVYSDADANAPHVAMADQAVRLGPGPVAQSYLNIDALLKACRVTLADAVHPGYGFLSENADFARSVPGGNPFRPPIFVGPSPEVIALMADKAAAKARMEQAGVSTIPGYDGADQSDEAMREAAQRIGLPVMIKARAGGGGRGMRLAELGGTSTSLTNALTAARAEAQAAFADGALMLERAIVNARHIEVQIIADAHGTVLHLGDRDCSAQRRNQKVVEEAPAPGLPDAVRTALHQAAVEAARAVGYVGAGTVEFLLDRDDTVYFIEMNTRLQVEHPVTEAITGLDLVELQLRVAQGQPLGLTQEDIRFDGHAIEARLCAEDPRAAFMPQTGAILLWRPPEGAGNRVDAGIAEGGVVSPHYDSMVAKIIAHGATRDQARRRLIGALGETALLGLRSNRAALINILTNSAFEAGTATTGLLDDLFNGPGCLPHGGEASPQFRAVAVALMVRLQADQARARSIGIAPDLIGWSNTGPRDFLRRYRIGDYEGPMLVKTEGTDIVVTEEAFSLGFMGPDEQMITNPISWADASAAVVAKADRRLVSAQATNADITETRVSLQIDGAKVHAVLNGLQALTYCYAVGPDGTLYLQEMGGEAPGWDVRETTFDRPRRPTEADLKTTKIKAPMYGVLVTLDVAEGDIVKGWSRIAVVEAMKMRHNLGIAGEGRGRVTRINAAVGDQVALDQVIAEIEKIPPEEDPDATGP